jgi:hypothetical protein
MDHAISTLFACGMTTAAFGIAPLARRILSGENPGAATRHTSREAGQETLEQQEREADALMRAHP